MTLRLCGLGLACLSILAFEILSTRLLSVIISESVIIFAIAIAMLGLGAAASVNSFYVNWRQRHKIRKFVGIIMLIYDTSHVFFGAT